MNIKIKFEPRDLWCGIYWNIEKYSNCPCGDETCDYSEFLVRILKIYICFVPCFPIIISKKLL